jgi:Ca-activated chloride channel family protein
VRQPRSFGERLEVRLVELYATVLDREGNPVEGLGREDFVVREDGVVQSLDAVAPSHDLPVTLGLALDTSASMFVKLQPVASAARSLLAGLVPGRDRAFLVAFGPEPRLIERTTDRLSEVAEALGTLEAQGRTPLWGGITASLEELAGARGKRALVVFHDGADEDGTRNHRQALQKAREVGAPIYLIVMNNEAARTDGRDFQTRAFTSRLERVAAAGGGEVLYLPTRGDLAPVYRRIEREIRSAYLLTYYPTVPLAPGPRRKVEVEVKRKGVTVRTLTGYEPS